LVIGFGVWVYVRGVMMLRASDDLRSRSRTTRYAVAHTLALNASRVRTIASSLHDLASGGLRTVRDRGNEPETRLRIEPARSWDVILKSMKHPEENLHP